MGPKKTYLNVTVPWYEFSRSDGKFAKLHAAEGFAVCLILTCFAKLYFEWLLYSHLSQR